MAFTWTNQIRAGEAIKDGLFSEIATKSSTVINSHCPANYTSNYAPHYNGYHGGYNGNVRSCANNSSHYNTDDSTQNWPY